MKRSLFFHCGALMCALVITASVFGQGDPEVIKRIVDEGKNHSRVWLYLSYLAEEIGPRLTGSAGLEEANNWTREMFERFGLSNAHLQQWGEIPVRFDRGPSRVRMLKPIEKDLEFTTRSWSAGTNGTVTGPVLKQPATMEDLEAMREKLAGAWIIGKAQRPGSRRGVMREGDAPDPQAQIIDALYEAGIAGRIVPASGDLVVTGGERNWRELNPDELPSRVTITVRRADYDTLNSRLADGEEVTIEASLEHHFTPGPIPLYNTVAEIPGTEWPEQVVIVSAHLDSWDGPGSQGAQDNGTGSSVTLETARLLMAAGAKPKRTIRFCLWTGEEQGLLGSKGYLDSLSDEEKANISAVLVDDGGTNYQGGLVCVADMSPMLTEATKAVNEAFADMKVEILARERMPRGGGSDHSTFNRAGIPGFFWDERGSGGREGKDYRYVHHTQHDTTRYAVPEYLVQSATCSAITAYNLAMADTMLPRYVAPPEEPEPQEEGEFTPTEGPLTGTWLATVYRNGEPTERTFTLSFEMSTQGSIRGWIESRSGQGRLRRVRFDPATKELTFRFGGRDFGPIEYKATVDGDQIKGSLNMGEEFNMQYEGERTSPDITRFEAPAEPAGDGVAGGDRPRRRPGRGGEPGEGPAAPAGEDSPAIPTSGG